MVARAVNAEPQPAGIRSGVQVFLDGAAPVDKEPACDVNTSPLCDGGGPSGLWTNYSLETVQRIGYGSFEPDNGVLIAKNKAWAAGATRGTEGSQCGYNCFTWVEDAHPEDMNQSTTTSPTARRSCARSPTTGSSTTRSSTRARTRAPRRSTSTRPTTCTST